MTTLTSLRAAAAGAAQGRDGAVNRNEEWKVSTTLALGKDTTRQMKNLGEMNLSEALGFIGISANRSRKLSNQTLDVVRGLSAVLRDQVLTAITIRSSREFVETRAALFPTYAKAQRALSDFAMIAVGKSVRDQLTNECFSELESDFRDAAPLLGTAIQEQAIFTVWTLRRIANLAGQLRERQLQEADASKDHQLQAEFAMNMLWMQFHLDCAIVAMRTQTAIYPEVALEIIDGLRAAVDAYGFIRQGHDLRFRPEEPVLSDRAWDEEEEELLQSSMMDLETEDA